MTIDNVLVFLLLLLATALGWWLARRKSVPGFRPRFDPSGLYHDYFVGLNYLLSGEPDEAIDTFIRALEESGDSAEVNLALGTLLRRRGKVDKAITVHQALLAISGLDPAVSAAAKLELARDYFAAGLLDRAERLLKEMIANRDGSRQDALRQLLAIYETEKEWISAINCVEQLMAMSMFRKDANLQGLAAHYCCELAEQARSVGDRERARSRIAEAFQFERQSVRASMLAATIEKEAGNYRQAIKELLQIRQRQPEYISELIEPMKECYEKLGEKKEFASFLQACLDEEPRVTVILFLAASISQEKGVTAATEFLAGRLTRHGSIRGMAALLDYQSQECSGSIRDNLILLKSITERWLARKPGYQCGSCGFLARSHYWQCPSCHKWDGIKPILGIEGE